MSEDGASQVVLGNVAELAQRQQARELGSSLARQIFRLIKTAQFHAVDNMAVLQQLDQAVEALKVFGAQTGEALTLLFAKSTVFVCGQLLKASRAEYESAIEISALVRRLGVTQLTIQSDAERADLTALARLFQPPMKVRAEQGTLEPSPRVRLRYVSAARLDENEEAMSPEDQILRTYVTTVVLMRRVQENLLAARYQLPNQAKRLAQRLVLLSEGDTPAFLGVTAMRTLGQDAAGRAVNRAILAVAMGRQLTSDLATISRIAMSALFFDVAVPLVSGAAGRGQDVVVTRMTKEAEKRLPPATASVLTALGHLREASLVRTVIAYEAHWLRQLEVLGPMYEGEYRPMVAARIVATAHRFNQLMDPDLAAKEAPSVDDALVKIAAEARDAVDQAMNVLLVNALGIFPRGTPVELSTGERAIVLRTPDNPADYARPSVRLVYDASGQPLKMKVMLDLSTDTSRQVTRVIEDPDAALLAASQAVQMAAQKPQAEASPSVAPNAIATLPPEAPRAEPAAPSKPPEISEPAAQPKPSEPPGPPVSQRKASVVMRRPRSTFVEVVESPVSRRDPRSDDFDPNEAEREPPTRPKSSVPATRPVSAPPSSGRRYDSYPEPTSPSAHWRRAPSPSLSAAMAAGVGSSTHAPSASGSLERTPLSNLLIYILDRTLGGTLVLTEPDGGEHAVHFQDGIPTKAHTSARVAALGSMLVAWGAIDQSQLESDPISQPPIHEATLEAELIDCALVRAEQIAEVRNEQLAERLSHLFTLPRQTRYAFYNGFDLLEAVWGRIGGVLSPLGILTRALREHPEEEAMDALLTKLAGARLELHSDADLMAFEFGDDELSVGMAIDSTKASVPDLIEGGYHPDAVRLVVYLLMITQCLSPLAD